MSYSPNLSSAFNDTRMRSVCVGLCRSSMAATMNGKRFDIRYTDASDLIPLTLPAKEILQGKWF